MKHKFRITLIFGDGYEPTAVNFEYEGTLIQMCEECIIFADERALVTGSTILVEMIA